MNALIVLISISIIMPVAWLFAEFRAGAVIRRTIGILTLLWSFGVAALFGKFENLNANAYFTSATSKLLEESVRHLQAGHRDAVLREWIEANKHFGQAYENRGDYLEVVEKAVQGMNRL